MELFKYEYVVPVSNKAGSPTVIESVPTSIASTPTKYVSLQPNQTAFRRE